MKKNIITAALILSLSSCSFTSNTPEADENLDKIIEDGISSLNKRTDNFSVFDGSYVTVEKNVTHSKHYRDPIDFFGVKPMNIHQTLDMLENLYNRPSYIADINSIKEELREQINKDEKRVVFKGNLGDFLNYLGKLYGVTMTLDEKDIIKVNFYTSKTYTLDQYLDGNKASAALSVGGGEGNSGGLTASSESKVESDTWKKVEKFLDDAIGEDGRATILEDFSIVKVTARPWVIDELDELFDRLKKESQMQVSVKYRIIAISKEKIDQLAAKFGINRVGDDYTILTDIVDAISLSQVGGGLAGTRRSVEGRLDAIVKSISQETISKGQMVGLPNRIMPINLTTTTSYIQEITREQNDNTGNINQSTKAGEITTGLSILILPKVLDDGRIQLTSGFTEKKLVKLSSLDGVQLPTIDETETLSTVTIDSGSIEMIALYTETARNNEKGMQLLGAGIEKKKDDRMIAVLIGADSYKLSSSVSKRG
ncbi:MAG: pilus assembly protein [Vibrionaceae bacterium]